MQRHEQVSWIVEQWFKPVLQIKITRLLIDGVDFDSSNSQLLGKALYAAQRVNQQQRPQPLALNSTIDPKPSEQDHGNVYAGQAFAFAVRQRIKENLVT